MSIMSDIFSYERHHQTFALLAPVTTTWSSRRCRAISQIAWISAVPSMIGFRSVPKNSKKSQCIMKQYRIEYVFFAKNSFFSSSKTQYSILNTNPERENSSPGWKLWRRSGSLKVVPWNFWSFCCEKPNVDTWHRARRDSTAGMDFVVKIEVGRWVDDLEDLEGGREKTSTKGPKNKISMVPMLKFEQTWQFRSFRVLWGTAFEWLRLIIPHWNWSPTFWGGETLPDKTRNKRTNDVTAVFLRWAMTSFQCRAPDPLWMVLASYGSSMRWRGNLQCTGKEAFWSTIYFDLFQQNKFDFNKKQGAHIGQGCYTLPGSGL